MAQETGIQQMTFVELARRPRQPFTSYGFVIKVPHYATLVAFTLGALYAVVLMVNPTLKAQTVVAVPTATLTARIETAIPATVPTR
jgi:hypothetical protein